MATFPSKVNYATGDILTATNMNDVGGAINLLDGAQYAGGKNRVLNSNMSIWQRGTSFANPSNAYTADRWLGSAAVSGTITRQTTSDTTNLPFIQYCLRYQRTAAATSTSALNINQSFETVNSIPLAGKTVTLSFYARAGANYSSASSVLNVQLLTGTGTDQNGYTTIYTGNAAAINQNATLTTTWQRFTYTATLPSTATELCLTIGYTPVGTAGAADYYEITGVQLEAANTASPYAPNGATFQAELAACQRYLPAITTSSASEIGSGYNLSTTQPFLFIPFQVPARVAPTGITATAANYAVRNVTGSTISLTAISFNNASVTGGALLGTVAAGLIAGQGTTVQLNGTLLFTGCEL